MQLTITTNKQKEEEMIKKEPIKKGKELVFDLTDRGFNVKAWYLNDDSGNALVKITKNGKHKRMESTRKEVWI